MQAPYSIRFGVEGLGFRMSKTLLVTCFLFLLIGIMGVIYGILKGGGSKRGI